MLSCTQRRDSGTERVVFKRLADIKGISEFAGIGVTRRTSSEGNRLNNEQTRVSPALTRRGVRMFD
jgi:hypothetical protein